MLKNKIENFLKDDRRKSLKLPNGVLVRKYLWGEDNISVETRNFSIESVKGNISRLCDRLIEKYSLQ